MSNSLTQNALQQFTGSESFYRHGLVRNVICSEGAKFFFDNAGNGGAYWLYDIIATEFFKHAKTYGIVFCKFNVSNQHGVITIDDGNGDVIVERVVGYTDCEEGMWLLYIAWDGQHCTVFLPSEY